MNVGLMSFKAGAHHLNLTNSIEAPRPVKTKQLEITYSQQLLEIHYCFVSRSQESDAFRLTNDWRGGSYYDPA